nr:hypothetical protein [Tanacetum cinerariifolium]
MPCLCDHRGMWDRRENVIIILVMKWLAKRWVDKLRPGTFDSWDLLMKAFIQRYCPPSNTAKQLEEICNFKQEGDKTLYQAWERYSDLLYRCPTHGINNHQKWHDGSSSRTIEGSSYKGNDYIENKLENLGRDTKKLKENIHAIQVGCQNYGGAHLEKDYPIKEEVKSIKEAKYGEFGRPLPFNLGASVNVIPKSIFKYLKLARIKKTDMLVEMVDMTKISPIGIVENVLVKIDKFLFPSDFMVVDMLNIRIICDRVTFDMEKKIHNFTTPRGEIYMINATCNTPSDASSRFEETNEVHNDYNKEQGRSRKRTRKLRFNINLPSTYFCKPVKQILEGELKFWQTCDPNIKECNRGYEGPSEHLAKDKGFGQECTKVKSPRDDVSDSALRRNICDK